MSSGYQHMSILECSHASSEEGKSGNNENLAMYHNKLGTGVKLNVGDTISVERAFISEIGAGGETIEFTGKKLPETYDIRYTLFEEFGIDSDFNKTLIKKPVMFASGNTPLVELDSPQLNIQDNVAYVETSFYKTTNGEFTISLPRSFTSVSDGIDYTETNIPWEKGCGGNLNLSDPNKFNNTNDSHYLTRKFGNDLLSCWNHRESTFNGAPQAWTDVGQRVESDYRKQDASTTLLGPQDVTGDLTSNGETGKFPCGEWEDGSCWKLKNDNSRYTLFTRQVNYRYYEKENFLEDDPKFGPLLYSRINDYMMDGKPERLDPSIRSYIKIVDAVRFEVPVGYNAPSNIADRITNQMNESGDIIQHTLGQNISPDNEVIAPIPATFTQSSQFYKPFSCATGNGFNEAAFRQFFSNPIDQVSVNVANGQAVINLPGQMKYLNSFETIGIKRADLWEFGHFLYPPTNVNTSDLDNKEEPTYNVNVTGAGAGQAIENVLFTCRNPNRVNGNFQVGDLPIFQSGIPYTRVNCDSIKALFDAQRKYPELFYQDGTHGYIGPTVDDAGTNQPFWKPSWWSKYTIDKSRFLHINRSDRVDRVGMSKDWLGSDNYWTQDSDISNFWTMNENNITGASVNTKLLVGAQDWRPGLEGDAAHAALLPKPAPYERAPWAWGPNLRQDQEETYGPVYKTGPEYNFASYPIFFYWDSTRNDVYSSSGGTTIGSTNELCYGSLQSSNGLDDGTGFIIFNQTPLHNTTPPWIRNFAGTGGTVGEINSYIDPAGADLNFRCMGWDTHFNSYSTAAILPWSGIAPTNCPVTTTQQPTQSSVEGVGSWTEGVGPDLKNLHDPHQFKWYGPKPSTEHAGQGLPQTPMGTILNSVNQHNKGTQLNNSIGFGYYNQLFMGANNPKLNFDSEASRFSLTGLHTPEFTGQDFLAGSNAANPTIADAATPVYHINKILKNNNWTPDMMPYDNWSTVAGKDPDEQADIFYFNNPNMTADAVFDCMSGVFIEKFGIPEKAWDKSFWGILGFSYSQFHVDPSKIVYNPKTFSYGLQTSQQRFNPIDDTGLQNSFTTNALVEVKNQPNWSKNYWGSDMLQPQVTHQKAQTSSTKQSQEIAEFKEDQREIPTVVVESESTALVATNLPRKMLRPYFTIRSDIITDPSWLGGPDSGQILPIVSIVSKQNAEGDFFFQENASDLVFVNTIPRTLTDVRISIHDPSGKYARVDPSSSILFKITKQVKADMNVVGTILQSLNKKQQEQELIALGIESQNKIII